MNCRIRLSGIGMMLLLLFVSCCSSTDHAKKDKNNNNNNKQNRNTQDSTGDLDSGSDIEITGDPDAVTDDVRRALLDALIKLAKKKQAEAKKREQQEEEEKSAQYHPPPTKPTSSQPNTNHKNEEQSTNYENIHYNSYAPHINSISGCEETSKQARQVKNCKTSGGQWITLVGEYFGTEGAVVTLHAKGGSNALCGFPRHWMSDPTRIVECRLPTSPHNTEYDVTIRSKDGTISPTVTKAVLYEKKEETPLPDFDDFESIGIGGLQKELNELKRKVFASRKGSNAQLLTSLGIRPIRGVLLYGPPGTGKTLVARKIAEVLNAKSVKVVNGPEIMSKYVGESESNLRGLFYNADQDYKQNKERSGLHVIVLDEMDAMLRHRGAGDDSAARAVYDGVTTQLLAMMDGFDSLPNVLLVGLTNRLEGIDKALLRPGRFEIKLRIPIPDEQARYEILRVHTKTLRDNNVLGSDVDLKSIAEMTSGFTGADIEGLVRASISHAMERNLAAAGTDAGLVVTTTEFLGAIRDIYSSHKIDSHATLYITRGILPYGPQFTKNILQPFQKHVQHLKTSPHTNVLRLIVEGKEGTGLTALASYFSCIADVSLVKFITASSLLGKRVEEKLSAVVSALDEIQDVGSGIVVIDTLEQLMEYNPYGTRVSTYLLHELSVLLSRTPPKSTKKTKVLILMTTHNIEALRTLQFQAYDAMIHVPQLTKADQFRVLKNLNVFKDEADAVAAVVHMPAFISIKKLMFLVDAAMGEDNVATPQLATNDMAAKYIPPRPLPTDADKQSQSSSSSSVPVKTHISVDTFENVAKEYGYYIDDPSGSTSARAISFA